MSKLEFPKAVFEVFAMSWSPTLLRITAHHTPHASDPPNAYEFYAVLGMFTVAWGRFEGHLTGCMLQILNLPEALAKSPEATPMSWSKKSKFWKDSFKSFGTLAPKRDTALTFMTRVMEEVKDRNFGAHAIWDEFVLEAPEPTAKARTITPRKGHVNIVDVADYSISLTLLRKALETANQLNLELCEFSSFLNSLRPPPTTARTL
jgi:hypothetical protein